MASSTTPDSGIAFIVDWFEHPVRPNEVHAMALRYSEASGLYEKILVRVAFSDFAYILLTTDPSPSTVDSLRRALGPGTAASATFRVIKTRTMTGYQENPIVPAILVRAADLATVLKHPLVKSLGGYVEEYTSVSRSRKLTAIRGMSQCCWIQLNGAIPVPAGSDGRMARADIDEYLFETWDRLTPVPLDGLKSFTPPPSSSFRVMGFDIEVYKPSSRGGGMPEASEPANIVTHISAVTSETPIPSGVERREVTLHTVYPADHPDVHYPPGTRVISYRTEQQMIRGWWDQVAAANPVLLLGFNTQGWDYRYLHERMKNVHKFPYPHALSIYESPPPLKMRTSGWSSVAYRRDDMLWPDIAGVVSLDLHKMYTRTRPALRRHNLETISQTYLGRGKYPMSQDRMVTAVESGSSHELALVGQYNIEDSVLVIDLYRSQHLFEEAAIEALASETLIDDLYTKGTQTRAINKLYRCAKESGYVMNTSKELSMARIGGGTGEHLVGAYVMTDTSGLFEDVAVYDVRSMYPTLLATLNVCFTTFVPNSTTPNDELIATSHRLTWETKVGEDENEKRTIHTATFVNAGKRQGLCPRLVEEQMALRERIREWARADSAASPDVQRILRYVQGGIKIVSNAIVGLMAGGETSRLAFPAGAGVVYTRARKTIQDVVADITSSWNEAPHGPVVYSDTDSVFVAGMAIPEARIALRDYLNKAYAPFTFELENVGRLLLLGAKNYILRPEGGEEMIYKGRELVGRSSAPVIMDARREAIAMIMNGRKRSEVEEFIRNTLAGLRSQPASEFVMTVKMGEGDRSVGGKFCRRLIGQRGAILQPGDQVEYVVLERPAAKCGMPPELTATGRVKKAKACIGDRMASPEELEEFTGDPYATSGGGASIDFDYYEKAMRAAFERLLVF